MAATNIEKLQQHTKEIYEIMFRAQSSFKIVDYLYRERDGLAIEIINTSQFLKYTAETHWRIYVIELAKLFAPRKSEHYNLHHFIEKFKPGMEYSISEIDADVIEKWEQLVDGEKTKINNLLQQRDKLYGHTDKDRHLVANILTFEDARKLIMIVKQVVAEIYDAVLGQSISLDPIGEPLEDLKRIICTLVDAKKQMYNDYSAVCKHCGIDPGELDIPQ